MNKIIIGLIATVVLLGVALVTLNNQLKPNVAGQSSMDGAAAPAARLPELPAIAGQTAQTKLMPLPTPPEGEAETLKDISVEANIDKKLPPLEDYVLHMPVSRPNSQTAQAQPAPSAAGSALLADSTQSRPLPPAAAADMQAAGQAVIQPVTRPAPAVTAAAAEKPAAKPAEDRPAVEKPAVKPAEDK
ncbi:MAG: hypothetical protein Q4F72_09330, partial [Desulfovibrionaceae bacterium]|nr:hypothetical protein [Desulfovibrionaceae bacterium]